MPPSCTLEKVTYARQIYQDASLAQIRCSRDSSKEVQALAFLVIWIFQGRVFKELSSMGLFFFLGSLSFFKGCLGKAAMTCSTGNRREHIIQGSMCLKKHSILPSDQAKQASVFGAGEAAGNRLEGQISAANMHTRSFPNIFFSLLK